jgi:hypothetical protein
MLPTSAIYNLIKSSFTEAGFSESNAEHWAGVFQDKMPSYCREDERQMRHELMDVAKGLLMTQNFSL